MHQQLQGHILFGLCIWMGPKENVDIVMVGRSEPVALTRKQSGEAIDLVFEAEGLFLWKIRFFSFIENNRHPCPIYQIKDFRKRIYQRGFSAGNHKDAVIPHEKTRFRQEVGIEIIR